MSRSGSTPWKLPNRAEQAPLYGIRCWPLVERSLLRCPQSRSCRAQQSALRGSMLDSCRAELAPLPSCALHDIVAPSRQGSELSWPHPTHAFTVPPDAERSVGEDRHDARTASRIRERSGAASGFQRRFLAQQCSPRRSTDSRHSLDALAQVCCHAPLVLAVQALALQ